MDREVPKFHTVVQKIREEIHLRGLTPGDPIPSEREIAKRYKVSYMTARRAVKELIDDGFLTRQGLNPATVVRIPDLSPASRHDPQKKYKVLVLTHPDILKNTSGTASILGGIALQILHEEGWKTRFVFPPPGKSPADSLKDELAGEKADGLLASCIYSESVAKIVYQSGIPAIFLDFAPLSVPVDSVVTDNRSITHLAMQHLLELGHKLIDFIGHLSGEKHDHDADDMEMYWRRHLDAVSGNGRSWYFRGGDDEARKLVSELLASPDVPTALFVSNLSRARELCAALKEKKFRIPKDISVITVGWNVGENDSDVTIIAVNWVEVVRMGVHRLADRMNNQAHSAARLSCSGQFLDAGTTGPPRKKQ